MTNETRLRTLLGAAILLLPWISSAAEIDGERLNAQTARITVDFADGGPSVGSGVVVCQVDSTAYILTARHVIHGPLNGPRKRANSVTVEFYKDQVPAIEGSLLSFQPRFSRQKDIALLRVDVGNNSLDPITVGRSEAVKALDAIYTTGHSAAKRRGWLAQNGNVNSAGELILHSASLEAGYSGGPLVDARGALVGMNTEVDTAGGTSTVGAIPIDEVLATIKEWVDLAHIRRAGDATSDDDGGRAPTREELADRFEEIRRKSRAPASDYETWLADAEAAVHRDRVSREFRTTFDLTKTEIEMQIRDEGPSFDRENVNYYIEELLWEWEDDQAGEFVDASGPDARTGGTPGPSTAGRIVGTYSLTNYTDLTGSYGPPLVTGQLTVTSSGGNAVALTISTQAPLIGLYVNMDVNGYYDGSTINGTVTRTNLANQGAPWAGRVTLAGSGMTWNFANGEIWVWIRN